MIKLSVQSREFLRPVIEALCEGKVLVVWHQIPWSGGDQEWFLLRREAALAEILRQGVVGSAFTIYEWHEMSWPRQVAPEWLTYATASLAEQDHDLLLWLIARDDIEASKLTWIDDAEALQLWYEQHVGVEVAVMRMPWGTKLSDGTIAEEVVRGYVPDAEGIPRSGAY